mgnify:CR=1 FL=1
MEIKFFHQEKYKCYHILKICNLFRKGLIYLKTKSKKFYYLYFIIFLFTIFIFFLPVFSFALGDPAIVNKINSAFEKIRDWIIKIATPAAAVAVGTGVFMKKFSFGDEEKIRTGKKLIKGSLFSYGFILAIDLILSAIKSLIG